MSYYDPYYSTPRSRRPSLSYVGTPASYVGTPASFSGVPLSSSYHEPVMHVSQDPPVPVLSTDRSDRPILNQATLRIPPRVRLFFLAISI